MHIHIASTGHCELVIWIHLPRLYIQSKECMCTFSRDESCVFVWMDTSRLYVHSRPDQRNLNTHCFNI